MRDVKIRNTTTPHSFPAWLRTRHHMLHESVKVWIEERRIAGDPPGIQRIVPMRTPRGQGLTYRNRTRIIWPIEYGTRKRWHKEPLSYAN